MPKHGLKIGRSTLGLDRLARFARIGLVLLLATGLSYKIDIIVEELGSGSPSFRFEKTLHSPREARVELNGFSVVPKRGGAWQYKDPMWEFQLAPGAYLEVERIRYGTVPPGFAELVTAKHLDPGTPYLALASGAGGAGSKEFMIAQ